MRNVFRIMAYVKHNMAELIVMTRHFFLLETHIVLRTIISAGVLAVLLAGTGAAAAGLTDDHASISEFFISLDFDLMRASS